jgi:hypothetical protein
MNGSPKRNNHKILRLLGSHSCINKNQRLPSSINSTVQQYQLNYCQLVRFIPMAWHYTKHGTTIQA